MNATTTKLNVKAADLRSELFALLSKFKALSQECFSVEGAFAQADDAACKLAEVSDTLGDLFTDAYRDPQDQSFAVKV